MTPYELVDFLAANKDKVEWQNLGESIRSKNLFPKNDKLSFIDECYLCPITAAVYLMTNKVYYSFLANTPDVYNIVSLDKNSVIDLIRAADLKEPEKEESKKIRKYILEKLVNVGNNATN